MRPATPTVAFWLSGGVTVIFAIGATATANVAELLTLCEFVTVTVTVSVSCQQGKVLA